MAETGFAQGSPVQLVLRRIHHQQNFIKTPQREVFRQ